MKHPENLDREKEHLSPKDDAKKNAQVLGASSNSLQSLKHQQGRTAYFSQLTVEEIGTVLKKSDPGFFRLAGSPSSIAGKINGDVLTLDMLSAMSVNNRHKVWKISFKLLSDKEGTKLIPCETPPEYLSEMMNAAFVLLIVYCIYKIYGPNIFHFGSFELWFIIIVLPIVYFVGLKRPKYFFGGRFQKPLQKEQDQLEEFIIKKLKAEAFDLNEEG